MFTNERIRKIRSFLLDYKKVDVNTLCSLLNTSISTIRRDLDRLEAEGFLRRVHGGAELIETNDAPAAAYPDLDYLPIALLASKLVRANDILFLGGGNLCLTIANTLIEEGWSGTVVTNNLNVACRMGTSPLVHVNLLGGTVINNGGRLITNGAETTGALRETFVNKAFVTITGFSTEYGIFVDSPEQAALYHALKERAMEVYLVVANRFNQIGRVRLGDANYFKRIISLPSTPDDVKRYCTENGITFYASFLDNRVS